MISEVHKDLFKGALAQVFSETLNKERVILMSSNVDTPAIHIKAASVLRDKAEKIQLDIANLAIRKQQLEWIIREAEQAKKEIPEIEQQLDQKRKDLYDTLKFMKNAEEVESKLSIVQNVSKRYLSINSFHGS